MTATPFQDVSTIITGDVETAYPGSDSVVGYWNPVTATIVATTALPAHPNMFQYAVIKTVLESVPQDQNFSEDQSTPERTALYNLIIARLTKEAAYISAIITSLTTEKNAF